jgi:transcriptional regulator with XRE-family HTH domain
MATLAERITELRGSRNYVEFAEFTSVNRQTLRDVESGSPPRIDTLREIARACRLGEEEWVELLVLWIRSTVGEDEFRKLDVRPSHACLAGSKRQDISVLLAVLFDNLTVGQKLLLLKALTQPEILRCVFEITKLYERALETGKAADKNDPVMDAAKRVITSKTMDDILGPCTSKVSTRQARTKSSLHCDALVEAISRSKR